MSLVPAFQIGVWNAWILLMWKPLIDMLLIRLSARRVCQKASGSSEMKASHRYKIASYVSMVIDFMAIVYSVFLPLQLGTAWFYVGLTIFLITLLVLAGASGRFVLTPIDEPSTKGVYRYSRHPQYLAISLIYLSVAIATASWVFLLVLIAQSASLRIAAVDEERHCLKVYGDDYRKYMARTPRWIGIPKS